MIDGCCVDGKACVKGACKLWYDFGKCWYRDFYDIIHSFSFAGASFKSDTSKMVYFGGELVEGLNSLGFYLDFSDKLDVEPIFMQVSINLNSHRLAEKVREYFSLLDCQVESKNDEGGDDASLVFRYELRCKCKEFVEKKLVFFTDLVPKIIEYEKIVNKCLMCGKKVLSLTEYDDKAICGDCERKIIVENIGRYVCLFCNGSGFDPEQSGGLMKWCRSCGGSGKPNNRQEKLPVWPVGRFIKEAETEAYKIDSNDID